MTSIEKVTIPLSKAAAIGLFIGQAVVTYMASYYGNKLAIQEVNFKLEKQELQWRASDDILRNQILSINTYLNKVAIKPEEPKSENYKEERN